MVILIQEKSVDLGLKQDMPKKTPFLTKEIQILFILVEHRARLLHDIWELPKAPNRNRQSVGTAVLTRYSWTVAP